jgi:hypothetical protein
MQGGIRRQQLLERSIEIGSGKICSGSSDAELGAEAVILGCWRGKWPWRLSEASRYAAQSLVPSRVSRRIGKRSVISRTARPLGVMVPGKTLVPRKISARG